MACLFDIARAATTSGLAAILDFKQKDDVFAAHDVSMVNTPVRYRYSAEHDWKLGRFYELISVSQRKRHREFSVI